MKLTAMAGLIGVLSLGLAATAWSEEGAPDANKENAVTAAPAVATPAKDSKLEKAVADVKAQADVAERLLKLYEEEMAKPESKRNLRKAQGLRLNAAQAYFRAALKAKADSALLTADEKPTFLEQNEKPNREKAVALLMELAAAARQQKDFRQAKSLYADVLKIDPTNTAAQEALKSLDEEMKTAAKKGAAGSGGSSDTNIKDWQKGYKQDYSQSPANTDWGRTGRPSY